jgi:signal transduction histidine kinase
VKHAVWLLAALWAYTLSFVVGNYWTRVFSNSHAAKDLQASLQAREAAFANFLNDTVTLARFLEGKASLMEIEEAAEMPFSAYVYQGDTGNLQLRWWSTNQVLPMLDDVATVPAGTLLRYGSGDYELLRVKIQLHGTQYTVIGLVQLRQQYIVENANLRVSFPGFSWLEHYVSLTYEPTAFPVVGVVGKVLAWLKPIEDSIPRGALIVQFLLQLSGLLLATVFVYRVSTSMITNGGIWQGMLWLAVCWLIGWLVMRHTQWLLSWQLLAIGNSTSGAGIYVVSELKKLLIDAVFLLFCGMALSANANQLHNALAALGKRSRQFAAVAVVVVVTMMHLWVVSRLIEVFGLQVISVSQSNYLVSDAEGVLERMNIFLYVIAHMLLSRFAGYLAFMHYKRGGWWMLLTQAVSGLLLLTLFASGNWVPLLLASLFWFLIFFYTVYNFSHTIERPSFLQSMNWLLVYAISLGVLSTSLYGARLRARAVEIGESLMQQNSRTVEYQVRIAAAGVKRVDWPGYLQAGSGAKRIAVIKDSVQQNLFGGYLKNFYTTIHIFSADGTEVAGNGQISLEGLNNLLNLQSEPTGFAGLGYLEESIYDFGYVFRHVVRNRASGDVLGYVFVTTRPGKQSRDPVLPELFSQLRELAADLPKGFSYAWYKNGQLVQQYRNYPFVSKIPENYMQRTMYVRERGGGNMEAWFNSGDGSTLVVATTRSYLVEFVSTTTQLFGLFLVCGLIIFVPQWVIQMVRLWPGSLSPKSFTIQQRLRATILGLLSISVLIIAIVTNRYFITEYRSKNESTLAGTIGRIADAIEQSMYQTSDTVKYASESEKWGDRLRQIANAENAEAAFYNMRGELIASTQQVLYDKGVLAPVMNPLPWYRITAQNVFRYMGPERIGNLKYVSAYQPVLNVKGETAGYVEVPFYAAENALRREISGFVVIVINIIAFVFLLSGFAAFYITGSITRSLNLIAERMQGLQLLGSNERIAWEGRDEIGALVQQYNKMVGQLEESARKLAQSERETAWREMARQVAHEIKNPLTPMKLSLQYLQKAIAGKDANVEAIMQRVSAGLVEQIDHLSRIAFDFSQFANLGTVHAEVFDMGEMLRRLSQLFAMQESVQIHVQVPNDLMVYADKTQLNRLFTNLLKNACEAKHAAREVSIEITGGTENDEVFVIVCDNGKGISPEVLERIFMPNFTTKSSGTGLGLAICKAIAENAGGRIKVRTQPEKGTCFQVSLPLNEA